MSKSNLALVVAIARAGVIGNNGMLPWSFPEDMKHFREATIGHAIIMGRKTWASIGKPLPKRTSIVVSASMHRSPATATYNDGILTCATLANAITTARVLCGDEEPRIIGGAGIYTEALPLATRIFLTEIDDAVFGDTVFHFDRAGWVETSRLPGEDPALSFVTLERQ
jgi:dihydrofolate reductase